jgi:hypothetical protein
METLKLNKLMNERNHNIVNDVKNLCVKDKRRMFAILRSMQPLHTINYIFTTHGALTVGEFCTSHVLNFDKHRNSKNCI